MKIALYVDNTLPLPLDRLCEFLNEACSSLEFVVGKEPIRLDRVALAGGVSSKTLPPDVIDATAEVDLAVIATNVPYANNYFYESLDQRVILSFNGWNLLTSLPIINGLVYFLATILVEELEIGSEHSENIGCINDFLYDKRGVDVGMRAAFLCDKCASDVKTDTRTNAVLADVHTLLDAVSQASRTNSDLLRIRIPEAEEDVFDVFLCHNSVDKEAVRTLNSRLQEAGVRTWLDEEQLIPGMAWQVELEEQISAIGGAAVCVGGSGYGPWQSQELRAFLSEFVERGCRVIPVLLPEAGHAPELPIFLKQMIWADLRTDYERNLSKLIEGLMRPNGRKSGRGKPV